MAVDKIALKKTLTINAGAGLDEKGNVKVKAFNFNGVNTAAVDDNIYAVGAGLSSLMKGDTESIQVTEKYELLEA